MTVGVVSPILLRSVARLRLSSVGVTTETATGTSISVSLRLRAVTTMSAPTEFSLSTFGGAPFASPPGATCADNGDAANATAIANPLADALRRAIIDPPVSTPPAHFRLQNTPAAIA